MKQRYWILLFAAIIAACLLVWLLPRGGGQTALVYQDGTLLLALSRRIKAAYPEKSIWSFTGYLFDRDILTRKLGPWEVTQELLSYLDVLVDGPFIASLKNLNLRFRGSSNQRLIDVPASLKTGAVVLWDERQ